ncbi:MAG: hypothetical protein ACRCW9_09965 [Cetobacterium sp.]
MLKEIVEEKAEKKRLNLIFLLKTNRENFDVMHVNFLPPEKNCIIELPDEETENKTLIHWYDENGINFNKFIYEPYHVYNKDYSYKFKALKEKNILVNKDIVILMHEKMCYFYFQTNIELSYQLKEIKHFKEKNIFTKGINFDFNK